MNLNSPSIFNNGQPFELSDHDMPMNGMRRVKGEYILPLVNIVQGANMEVVEEKGMNSWILYPVADNSDYLFPKLFHGLAFFTRTNKSNDDCTNSSDNNTDVK